MLVHGTTLPNGMDVRIDDQSSRYFGDYFHVKINLTLTIPVDQVPGIPPEERDTVQRAGLRELTYVKTLSAMGVSSSDVPAVQEQLLRDYSAHASTYLAAAHFPVHLLRVELQRRAKLRPKSFA